MAFAVVFVVMLVAIFILSSVLKSFERTTALERSNQVFYAAESGLEAAFFHASVRGPGVHFVTDDDSQKIDLNAIDSNVRWTIKGRAKPVTGILHEFENVEIPLYWDNSSKPTDENTTANTDDINNKIFTLTFDGSDIDSSYKFGELDENNNPQDEVFIDWKITQKSDDEERQTLIPYAPSNDEPCGIGHTYICEKDIINKSVEIHNAANSAIQIQTLPPQPPNTGAIYLSDTNEGLNSEATHTPKLSFQSLLKYTTTNGNNKIAGIPYAVQTNNTPLPTPTYTATAHVNYGDGFEKKVQVTVPHRKAIGAFSYVIFD